MNREYYISWYRLNQKDAYLIWFSTNDDDGVFVDNNGFVPNFESQENLIDFAKTHEINLKIEEPLLHNLDILKTWLEDSNNVEIDCVEFLNLWNLFDDVSNSTNGGFNSDRKLTMKIYEKLFWGNNLPSVTPEGKSYEPIWSKKELKIIRETLTLGFQMFRDKVKQFN
jgi:hypothetical protein